MQALAPQGSSQTRMSFFDERTRLVDMAEDVKLTCFYGSNHLLRHIRGRLSVICDPPLGGNLIPISPERSWPISIGENARIHLARA